jgi:hypothetical protein
MQERHCDRLGLGETDSETDSDSGDRERTQNWRVKATERYNLVGVTDTIIRVSFIHTVLSLIGSRAV